MLNSLKVNTIKQNDDLDKLILKAATNRNNNENTRNKPIKFSLTNSISGKSKKDQILTFRNNHDLKATALFHQKKSLSKKTIFAPGLQSLLKKIKLEKKCSLGERNDFEKIKELKEEGSIPQEVIQKYSDLLTDYEKEEMLNYKKVYYMSDLLKTSGDNITFTDNDGYYNIYLSDQIAYRYEILQYIGKGSFGQALKCFDHKEKKMVSLKILKSKKELYNQGMVEAKILKYINENDSKGAAHVVKIYDYFVFRKHIMIVAELLSINLFVLLANNKFKGISLGLIKRFALQLIDSLSFLRKHKIIHCDLKPENVLLEEPNKSGIKLIDFGSSCFSNQKIYTYIQSRFYRAPEIMLGDRKSVV